MNACVDGLMSPWIRKGWRKLPQRRSRFNETIPSTQFIARTCARTRQTAEVLRRETKAPVTHTSDLRPWNLGVFCGQRVREILPYLNLLNQHPDLAAPSGESFYQFYGRYAHRLHELLARTEQSPNCVVAVTHVRNLLASATIILGGNKDKVPVKGGPHTGALVVVEKVDGSWKIHNGSRPLAAAEPEVIAAMPIRVGTHV